MDNVSRVGIDLAKRVFHVTAVEAFPGFFRVSLGLAKFSLTH